MRTPQEWSKYPFGPYSIILKVDKNKFLVKIPAAGKPGVVAGDKVMTYTPGGNGVIGERGIYNDASSYNAATDADKLITAAAPSASDCANYCAYRCSYYVNHYAGFRSAVFEAVAN